MLALRQLSSLALIVLAIGVPLGVAGQYITEGIFALLCWYMMWRWRKSVQLKLAAIFPVIPVVLATLVYCAWMSLATGLNEANTVSAWKPLTGMLDLWLLPIVAISAYPVLRDPQKRWLEVGLCIVLASVSLVALSQLIWGWKLEDGAILSDHQRARGFYSHPLTLAYAFLALLAPVCFQLRMRSKQVFSWFLLVTVAWLVFASLSRIAILIGSAYIIYMLLQTKLKPKQWRRIAGLAIVIILVLSVAPNPIRDRVSQSFQKFGEDRHTETYADDRLAFWHAHWLMIQERPLLGHGVRLNGEYRKPYYERLGLGDFIKQYEAHNQWLQIWAEGGIIGLLIFLFWHLVWIGTLRRLSPELPIWLNPGVHALILIGLGGLTQNAFQDAEVRFTLICILSLSPLLINTKTIT